jgi:REP element-mobilizing transposase RayT
MTSTASPGYRALRRVRFSNPGQVYLLTTVTQGRRRLFSDPSAASDVSTTLREDRLWRDSRLLCWVLMPDHMHLLLSLGTTEGLPELMRRAKAMTSAAARASATEQRFQRTWMPGYHDRALRREENIVVVARYIVANPLRAGLVRRVRDYPYWGSIWN